MAAKKPLLEVMQLERLVLEGILPFPPKCATVGPTSL